MCDGKSLLIVIRKPKSNSLRSESTGKMGLKKLLSVYLRAKKVGVSEFEDYNS